ncbi:DUF4411 family protein [Clavibacter michiganensis]|uniref:DUF4411 family protein n=1 Tax=Clavibacter michiganensis TaxID=28447 RepID=UPI000B747539|nr:DUF4411 family protein [Clavibacter michiganensis]OUD88802.1 hypothetical protein CMMCAS05_15330 [Clavibacter michiganensis subsp. michiganensis]OUE13154.1 hypothetical protein CMMCAY01_09140 [Clavibacter michiganensis subsp. michiganensis]
MYLLDANVFITAKNVHYGFDVVPGFWDWVDAAVALRRAISIDKVQEELRAQRDELSEWARDRSTMFRRSDEDLTPALIAIAQWATAQPRFEQAALATFLDSADFFLIAHALTHGDTVVTHEVPAPASKTRVKIPDACIGVGVRYTNPYAMLRTERARFELR